jgi:hypothetical protein
MYDSHYTENHFSKILISKKFEKLNLNFKLDLDFYQLDFFLNQKKQFDFEIEIEIEIEFVTFKTFQNISKQIQIFGRTFCV